MVSDIEKPLPFYSIVVQFLRPHLMVWTRLKGWPLFFVYLSGLVGQVATPLLMANRAGYPALLMSGVFNILFLFYYLGWPLVVILECSDRNRIDPSVWKYDAAVFCSLFPLHLAILIAGLVFGGSVLGQLLLMLFLIAALALTLNLQWTAARFLADGYETSKRPIDAAFRMWLLLVFVPLSATFARQRLDRVSFRYPD